MGKTRRSKSIAYLFLFGWASLELEHVRAFSSSPIRTLLPRGISQMRSLSLGVSATPIEPRQIYAVSSNQDPNKRRKKNSKVSTPGTNKNILNRNDLPSFHTSKLRLANMKATRKKLPVIDRLTRDEEKQLTKQIRALRQCVRIRDEIALENPSSIEGSYQPSEEQWAKACNLSVNQLRKVMLAGQEARSRIVEGNGRLVTSIAKRYFYPVAQANEANNGVGTILSFSDLIQEGNLGLIEAAERFEPERNIKFGTYASWWVRQRMLKAISDYSRIIRLPSNVYTMVRKVQRARKDLEGRLGRYPTNAEISRYMGITLEKVHLYTKSTRTVLSLEQPIRGNTRKSGDRPVTLGEFLSADAPSPEEHAEHQALRETLLSVIEELKPNEKDVLIARYGLDDGSPKTVEETSLRIGTSRDRVRVIEARALNKLRNPVRNHRLKSYIEESNEEDESEELALTPEQIWSF